MANIAFDSKMDMSNHTGSPASPITDSFTNTAGNAVYVGLVFRGTGADILTGVTYGGQAMTIVKKLNTGGEPNAVYVLKLNNAPTGANTISVSYSGSPTAIRVAAVSYQNVNDVDASATSNGTATSGTQTVSVTPTVANTWAVLWFWQDENGTQAAGTGVTIRSGGVNNDPGFFDSNGTIAIAPYSMTVTWTGTTADYQSIQFTISPSVAVAATPAGYNFFL